MFKKFTKLYMHKFNVKFSTPISKSTSDLVTNDNTSVTTTTTRSGARSLQVESKRRQRVCGWNFTKWIRRICICTSTLWEAAALYWVRSRRRRCRRRLWYSGTTTSSRTLNSGARFSEWRMIITLHKASLITSLPTRQRFIGSYVISSSSSSTTTTNIRKQA